MNISSLNRGGLTIEDPLKRRWDFLTRGDYRRLSVSFPWIELRRLAIDDQKNKSHVTPRRRVLTRYNLNIFQTNKIPSRAEVLFTQYRSRSCIEQEIQGICPHKPKLSSTA
jgi:hypothetical protein